MRLWTRISLLAALNIGLLAAVMFVFVRIELSNEFESFLLASARDKIQGISTQLGLDIQESDRSQWDSILKEYSDAYGVTFMLFGPNLTQLAGPRIPVPQEIEERFGRGGGPPGGGQRGEQGQQGQRGQRGQRGGGRRLPPPPVLINSQSDIPFWVGMGLNLELELESAPIEVLPLLASDSLLTNQFFFNWPSWLGVLAGVLLVSAICWLPLMRGLTHSIAQMKGAAAEIAEGKFDVELRVQRKDELGQLAASINRMASKLETFTKGQKRFLGDVAHELRSPIGRMTLEVGILERKASADEHQTLADLKEDIAVMGSLTDRLLQVAKAGVKPESLVLEPTAVAPVVETAIRREVPDGMRVETAIDSSLQVQANADYLLSALSNVLRNSIRYAGDAGPIRVAAVHEKGMAIITIVDSGPGVPDEALDKIFTPFYRLDRSRTSKTGGTGLGLAIVRNSIEACGGTVEARNVRPSGLEVVIKLPRSPSARL